MDKLTHDEMRFLRRELINKVIRWHYRCELVPFASTIKYFVRTEERLDYDMELRAYSGDWQ